jgi:glutamine synthetase
MNKVKLEYIWIDGHQPTQKLRSKTKVLDGPIENLDQIPDWGFDGSSTNQAEGTDSDCLLKPAFLAPDPVRGEDSFLVMCEVMNADGTPHKTNMRAACKVTANKFLSEEPWFGIEQEYTFFKGGLHWVGLKGAILLPKDLFIAV